MSDGLTGMWMAPCVGEPLLSRTCRSELAMASVGVSILLVEDREPLGVAESDIHPTEEAS
jgi:hypothetical protein